MARILRVKVALFDMDLIAYRSAAAVEERKVQVQHIKTQKIKEFKTRTEFKDILKSKDKPFNAEDWIIKIFKFLSLLNMLIK